MTTPGFRGSAMLAVLDLIGGYQNGRAFVRNQEHHEFRRVGLAGISPDDVNIRGGFADYSVLRQETKRIGLYRVAVSVVSQGNYGIGATGASSWKKAR